MPSPGRRSCLTLHHGCEAVTAHLTSHGAAIHVSEGQDVFQQGDHATLVHVVGDGLVKLQCVGANGSLVIVGLRARGWILGASDAILEQPYAATASAVTRCRLHAIQARAFRELLCTDHAVSWYSHEMHSREIHGQMQQIRGLSCTSAHERLDDLFGQLAADPALPRDEASGALRVPLRHWELAQLVAVTPQYLTRVFAEFERSGIAHREGRWLVIQTR